MLSRIVRQPVQTIARRNMSLKTLLGGTKQDIRVAQKKNLQMDLRWTFLRGGKKDDVIVFTALLMAAGIFVNVGRGFYKMSKGQKN